MAMAGLLLSCSKTGSSSDSSLARIAGQELLMEGARIDRSPGQEFAQQMHDRNENLGKMEKDILQQSIPTEAEEGMELAVVEPFRITSLSYVGETNVSVEMEALIEIAEEGVSQREVRSPRPGTAGPYVAVGYDDGGEACVPVFVKFRGVEGNKGSQYDEHFTKGDKFRLVANFKITPADAKRWERVKAIGLTFIGSPDFNGPMEEMSAERSEYDKKYGR